MTDHVDSTHLVGPHPGLTLNDHGQRRQVDRNLLSMIHISQGNALEFRIRLAFVNLLALYRDDASGST